MADAKFDPIGVALICGALVADALIGNVQEYVLKTYHVTTSDLMFYSKFWGLGLFSVALYLSGILDTLCAWIVDVGVRRVFACISIHVGASTSVCLFCWLFLLRVRW